MQMEFYLSFASILENEYYWWYEYISLKKEYTSILEKFHKNLLCSKQDQFPGNKCFIVFKDFVHTLVSIFIMWLSVC